MLLTAISKQDIENQGASIISLIIIILICLAMIYGTILFFKALKIYIKKNKKD